MTRGARPAAAAVLALLVSACGSSGPDDEAAKADARQRADRAANRDASGNTHNPAAPITKRRLGSGVNTSSAELLPIASADGDTLYFTRANYPDPTMRAFMQTKMNERLEACRSGAGAVEAAAKTEGATLSEDDRAMIARLSGDCDRIVEIRDRDLHNFDRSPHPNQVYVSRRGSDGVWTPAERLPAPINDESLTNIGNVSITAASPDRRTLLLMGDFLFGRQRTDRCVDFAAMLGAGDMECLPLAVARDTGRGWAREDRIRTKAYSTRLNVTGGALAPDGRTIVFSARDRNTNAGNHSRLFVSRWDESSGLWSAPREIAQLKGAFDTVTPFIGPDGRSLYFASDRPGGHGGFDLYMARRRDDTWLAWSDPENLGPHVNSADQDLSISVDASGRYAFMASGKGTALDIYEFNLPPNLSPAPTAIVGGRIFVGGGPLGGMLPDGAGGTGGPFQPPPAGAGGGSGDGGNLAGGGAGAGGAGGRDAHTVVFVRLSDGAVAGQSGLGLAGETGSYETRLPLGEQYAAYVSAPGFAGIGQVIDLTNAGQDQRVEQDLSVAKLETGAVIRLNNVFFDTDSAELLPKSRAELDRLTLTLTRYSKMKIEIAGHTDARSSDEHNDALSDRRAASVREYLERAGIASARLTSRGYGERSPIATNDTEDGMAINRRVEFRILSM